MEGYSSFVYKNKEILYLDYSIFQNEKDKMVQVLNAVTAEWVKQPPASIVTLVNVEGLHYDMEVLKAFKNSTEQITPHVKKLALIGVKGLLKTAYQFVSGFATHSSRRLFDNELEAKEWLVEDE